MEPLPNYKSDKTYGRQSASWVKFFRPMLLISLVLHGLVLMVPVSSEEVVDEEAAEAEVEEEEEEEMIGLSALQAPPPSPEPEPEPQPELPLSATPAPVPTPVFTPIPRTNPAPAPPPASPAPEPEPEPTPIAAATPEPSPEPTPEATPTPTDTGRGGGADNMPEDDGPSQAELDAQVAAARFQLSSNFEQMGSNTGLAPPFTYFEDSATAYFTNPDQARNNTRDSNYWVDGIVGIDWHDGGDNQGLPLRKEELVARLESQFAAQGFTMQPAGEYGEGELFEVANEAETLIFLNIFPAPGNSSVIVVQWEHNPNSPSDTSPAGVQTGVGQS